MVKLKILKELLKELEESRGVAVDGKTILYLADFKTKPSRQRRKTNLQEG